MNWTLGNEQHSHKLHTWLRGNRKKDKYFFENNSIRQLKLPVIHQFHHNNQIGSYFLPPKNQPNQTTQIDPLLQLKH